MVFRKWGSIPIWNSTFNTRWLTVIEIRKGFSSGPKVAKNCGRRLFFKVRVARGAAFTLTHGKLHSRIASLFDQISYPRLAAHGPGESGQTLATF